ncbi:MAG: outer membrane protein transport protein [Pseudomonadota bacterium]
MTRAQNAALASSVVALALTSLSGQALAGAFQLNERSAKSQGMSFADSVSGAKDPTYAGFNPAALSKVEGFQAAGNLSGVFPISDGETTSAVFNGAPIPVSAVPGSVETSTNADRSGFVPASALGYRVSDRLAIGLTVNAPFGLSTENPDNFIGAGDGIQSKLLTVQISPAFAVDVTDRLALGASMNLLFVDARLTSSVVSLDGDDLTVGFSVGALWEPIDGTQIGLAYHHGYDLDAEVTTDFSPIAPAPLGLFSGQELQGVVQGDLPATFQVGVTQAITDTMRVSAEFRYINWSVFDELTTIVPAFDLETDDAQNYRDAIFAAVGGEMDISDDFTVRVGFAYDKTPTQDTTALTEASLGRTVRVPDETRLWFSAGISHDMQMFGLDMTVDAGYSYLYAIDDPEVVIRTGPFAGSTVTYDGGAHIFSVGGSVRF